MKLCLITALTDGSGGRDGRVTDMQDAPLGPLTLAAILQKQGAAVCLVDLDQEFARRDCAAGPAAFVNGIARRLASMPAGIFGFSTLCSSYPLTLRLAKLVKEQRPESVIVLGGPQASVVDAATLRKFPHVDFILRGEADHSLPALLDALQGAGRHLHFVPGLTWCLGHTIQRNPDPPPVEDLDRLPLPAYSLYGDLEITSCISLEIGRGCPFACSFCSTNDFFRRRFRLKSPEVVIGQMRELHTRYQVRNFSLVHDMFTVDRRRVVEFCRAMIDSGCGFHWSCSARTDCVDEELLALMARAGCEGIFYGIETGSQPLQKTINKSLDVLRALQVVQETSAHGIPSTASAITGFPGENVTDFRDTVDFLMNAACGDNVETQLHLLAPLAGTPIARQHERELVLDRIQSDISLSMLLTPEDWAWIESSPEIFTSFYHVPSPHLDRGRLVEFRSFLAIGLRRARWLFIALHQIQGHIVDVFDAWRHADAARGGNGDFDAFLDFVAERYLHPAITAILFLQRALRNQPVPHDNGLRPLRTAPAISPHTRVVALPFSMSVWLRCLRDHRLREFRDQSPCIVAITGDRRRERVLDLHPIQASVLALCDGVRDHAAIAESLDWTTWNQFPEVPRPVVVTIALDALAQDGLILWGDSMPDRMPAQAEAAA